MRVQSGGRQRDVPMAAGAQSKVSHKTSMDRPMMATVSLKLWQSCGVRCRGYHLPRAASSVTRCSQPSGCLLLGAVGRGCSGLSVRSETA